MNIYNLQLMQIIPIIKTVSLKQF